MNEKLMEAIRLRTSGQLEDSRKLLVGLVSEFPDDAQVLYQCGWTHDSLGLEKLAVGFYERAIENGLAGEDLAKCMLGLGSTLRGLGDYSRALKILEKGVGTFPSDKPLKVFLALANYSSGRTKEAVTELLKLLLETTSSNDILGYKESLLMYAVDLDRVWKEE